jgi:hypothetical protein
LTKLEQQNNEEEKKEEDEYGFNAISLDESRPRGATQPKLSFPLA